jgi:hypothetical protein
MNEATTTLTRAETCDSVSSSEGSEGFRKVSVRLRTRVIQLAEHTPHDTEKLSNPLTKRTLS